MFDLTGKTENAPSPHSSDLSSDDLPLIERGLGTKCYVPVKAITTILRALPICIVALLLQLLCTSDGRATLAADDGPAGGSAAEDPYAGLRHKAWFFNRDFRPATKNSIAHIAVPQGRHGWLAATGAFLGHDLYVVTAAHVFASNGAWRTAGGVPSWQRAWVKPAACGQDAPIESMELGTLNPEGERHKDYAVVKLKYNPCRNIIHHTGWVMDSDAEKKYLGPGGTAQLWAIYDQDSFIKEWRKEGYGSFYFSGPSRVSSLFTGDAYQMYSLGYVQDFPTQGGQSMYDHKINSTQSASGGVLGVSAEYNGKWYFYYVGIHVSQYNEKRLNRAIKLDDGFLRFLKRHYPNLNLVY